MTSLNLTRDEDLNRGKDGANEEKGEFRNLLGRLYRRTQYHGLSKRKKQKGGD